MTNAALPWSSLNEMGGAFIYSGYAHALYLACNSMYSVYV